METEKKNKEISKENIPSEANNDNIPPQQDNLNLPTEQKTLSNMSISENPNNAIEFNKLQGFDVLEKLPDKNVNDTYNQEFYTTLENLKFLSLSIPDEDRLFYHFELNENASVSSQANQVLKSFMELFMNKMTVRKTIRGIKKDIKQIFSGFEKFDINIIEEIRPEIVKMEKRLQNFLVDQKSETIRIIKEIATLQKEKDNLKKEIEDCMERLDKLEKEIGTNKDYIRTTSDIKANSSRNNVVNKQNSFKKKNYNSKESSKKDVTNNNEQGEMEMNNTKKTVTSPGENLTENFGVKTVGTLNFS